jgi:hypothetical protein
MQLKREPCRTKIKMNTGQTKTTFKCRPFICTWYVEEEDGGEYAVEEGALSYQDENVMNHIEGTEEFLCSSEQLQQTVVSKYLPLNSFDMLSLIDSVHYNQLLVPAMGHFPLWGGLLLDEVQHGVCGNYIQYDIYGL